MTKQTLQPADTEVLKLRAANKEVVETFLQLDATSDLNKRMQMFTDDIHIEEMSTKECVSKWISGKNNVRNYYEKLSHAWKQLKYSETHVYQTEDPKIYIASAWSNGIIQDVFMKTPHPYDNYNIFIFEIIDSKIRRISHFCNSMKLHYAYWHIWLDDVR